MTDGLKAVYRGGRLIGFLDKNNFPVPLSKARDAIPMALAPMARRDAEGRVHITGGDPEQVARLAEAVEAAMSKPPEKPKPAKRGRRSSKKKG